MSPDAISTLIHTSLHCRLAFLSDIWLPHGQLWVITERTASLTWLSYCVFQPEYHWEPRNDVGSLSPAERLVGFEPGSFISSSFILFFVFLMSPLFLLSKRTSIIFYFILISLRKMIADADVFSVYVCILYLQFRVPCLFIQQCVLLKVNWCY